MTYAIDWTTWNAPQGIVKQIPELIHFPLRSMSSEEA